MNEDHRLNAPNNDSLDSIEQLGDRSDLSTLYPEAHKGWDGDLLSTTDRETKRDKQLDEFARSIRKKAVLIGLLVPMPIIVGATVIAILLQYVIPLNASNTAYNVLPGIVGAALVLGVAYGVLKKLYQLFYQHTLRLGPFLMIMWALLGISAQSFYVATMPLHSNTPVSAVLFVSGIGIFWSMALSIFLLAIWTSSRLSSGAKMGYIALLALGIVVITGALSVVNVLL